MNLDPDVQRYLADQFLVRFDMVAWAFTALLICLLVRLVAKPVVDTIHQVELSTVNIIKAWRK